MSDRPHIPVMLAEVLAAAKVTDGDVVVDATFGNGGYSEALLNSADCSVIGLDRDPSVQPRATQLSDAYPGRFQLVETPFSEMDQHGLPMADVVVFDIGVSSMQIDQAERGFSFQKDGPLDMRMSRSGPTARDAVMTLHEDELSTLFKFYGEERHSRRAAQRIVEARGEDDINTTGQLATIIENAIGRSGKIHPATRIFQALRIYINDELGELYRGLCAAERLLKPGGRLVVVTFHSLEDRIAKQFLRDRAGEVEGGSRYAPAVVKTGPDASFTLPRRSVVKPTKSEESENPRSRSAKLRVAVRTNAAAQVPEPTAWHPAKLVLPTLERLT
ncbi:ribosomal RNA small subunit methyltransferase H [Algimonas arctica]|uniref:Ribosomal RNA small subunit methyltransferase H n=1 Tax=Algimonas arctica TaxID=1479486 RepID=A0A8J3CSZ0_9PROT|nr:16S rRNA (cytosine(1402)-N(4))-methyltransferase RsmH [Algimonas arctica]GHB01324.1 ribosomal RNA small subunit methyltransferase H [Algimonas arctica]